jgi:hypothetical protein
MTMYKLQVQEDDNAPDVWRDVLDVEGKPALFDNEAKARITLAALFPVLVKMEALQADRKRTRVIVVAPYDDIDNPKDD